MNLKHTVPHVRGSLCIHGGQVSETATRCRSLVLRLLGSRWSRLLRAVSHLVTRLATTVASEDSTTCWCGCGGLPVAGVRCRMSRCGTVLRGVALSGARVWVGVVTPTTARSWSLVLSIARAALLWLIPPALRRLRRAGRAFRAALLLLLVPEHICLMRSFSISMQQSIRSHRVWLLVPERASLMRVLSPSL